MNKIYVFLKKRYKLLLGMLILTLGTLTLILDRGTYSTEEETVDNNSLDINCNDAIGKGQEFVCNVNFEKTNDTGLVQGIITNLKLQEGIHFVSTNFGTNDAFYGAENGIALVNLNGVSNSLGTITLRMDENVIPNNKYRIELNNSTTGGLDLEESKLESVYFDVRVKSDINTLDSILVNNKSLENFDKEKTDYMVSFVNALETSVIVSKTDEHSTVTGGEERVIELHYGSNIVEIVVVSEDGQERKYSLNLFNSFELNGSRGKNTDYFVDNEKGYIFVGTESDTNVILQNIDIAADFGLTKEIVDNKILIKYGDELVSEYNIYYMSASDFKIDNELKQIFVVPNTKVEDLIENIVISDSFDLKFYKDDAEVINSDILLTGMNMYIFDEEQEIDHYTIYEYEFDFGDYYYSKEKNYIYTGLDINDEIILKKINLPENISSEIENNKLILIYNSIPISSIDIVNINFENYEIIDKKIMILQDMLVDDFINKISFNGDVNLSVTSEDVIINGTDKILNNMVLNVKIDNVQVDNFVFNTYQLTFDSSLDVLLLDNENYIINLLSGIKVSDILSKIQISSGYVSISNKNLETKPIDAIIATGDILSVHFNDKLVKSYKLSVIGDSTGDGKVMLDDLAAFRKHFVSWIDGSGNPFELVGEYRMAMDLNSNGQVELDDLAMIRELIIEVFEGE